MKKFISLMVLTLSVSAFAQERVLLNSSEVVTPSSSVTLVRTAATPKKVEIKFTNIPTTTRVCYERYVVPRTCFRTVDVYRTERVCRDVTSTPAPTPGRPTGPRYNPPGTTTRVCSNVQVRVGTRQMPYDCSYSECRYRTEGSGVVSDKVKIKFELPALGGTEEETFAVTATQNGSDNSNIVYSIVPTSTINNRSYKVDKKGLFGYDSYVIEQ
jgi:hypothetical protein